MFPAVRRVMTEREPPSLGLERPGGVGWPHPAKMLLDPRRRATERKIPSAKRYQLPPAPALCLCFS